MHRLLIGVSGGDDGWPTQVPAGLDGRAPVDHVLAMRVSLPLDDDFGSSRGFAVGMADVVAGPVTETTLAVGTAVFA